VSDEDLEIIENYNDYIAYEYGSYCGNSNRKIPLLNDIIDLVTPEQGGVSRSKDV